MKLELGFHVKISAIVRNRRPITRKNGHYVGFWDLKERKSRLLFPDELGQIIRLTEKQESPSGVGTAQCHVFTSRDQCRAMLNLCSVCQWSVVDQHHTLKSRRKDREAEKKSLNKLETLVCDALAANGKSGRTIPFSGLQQLSHKLSSCNVHIFV